jgi:hypothetical protein
MNSNLKEIQLTTNIELEIRMIPTKILVNVQTTHNNET